MNAGGTSGGGNKFLLGMVMFIAGGYLFLNSIQVTMFSGLFRIGGMQITTGYVLIPFLFGVVLMFMNYKNPIGWLLTFGSLVMLFFGIISSINFMFTNTSLFNLIIILILICGGAGFILSSFRKS